MNGEPAQGAGRGEVEGRGLRGKCMPVNVGALVVQTLAVTGHDSWWLPSSPGDYQASATWSSEVTAMVQPREGLQGWLCWHEKVRHVTEQ